MWILNLSCCDFPYLTWQYWKDNKYEGRRLIGEKYEIRNDRLIPIVRFKLPLSIGSLFLSFFLSHPLALLLSYCILLGFQLESRNVQDRLADFGAGSGIFRRRFISTALSWSGLRSQVIARCFRLVSSAHPATRSNPSGQRRHLVYFLHQRNEF